MYASPQRWEAGMGWWGTLPAWVIPTPGFPCIWPAPMAAQGVFYPLNITWALGCAEIISMGKP